MIFLLLKYFQETIGQQEMCVLFHLLDYGHIPIHVSVSWVSCGFLSVVTVVGRGKRFSSSKSIPVLSPTQAHVEWVLRFSAR